MSSRVNFPGTHSWLSGSMCAAKSIKEKSLHVRQRADLSTPLGLPINISQPLIAMAA